MKRLNYVGMFIVLLLALTGCQKQSQQEQEIHKLYGFIKGINEESVFIDQVEYITSEDEKRIQELNLTEKDLLNGYYIYNAEEDTSEYRLTPDTLYNFIDWGRDFTDSDAPEDVNISTKEVNDFIKYINTYTNAQPGMPFSFEIMGEEVVSITEEPMA